MEGEPSATLSRVRVKQLWLGEVWAWAAAVKARKRVVVERREVNIMTVVTGRQLTVLNWGDRSDSS